MTGVRYIRNLGGASGLQYVYIFFAQHIRVE